MWTEQADVRLFLRTMVRDIIAEYAAEERDESDHLIDRYLTRPTLTFLIYRLTLPLKQHNRSFPRSLIVAAALMAVLQYLVREYEFQTYPTSRAHLRSGIMRLFRDGSGDSNTRLRLIAARNGQPERLSLIVHDTSLPLGISVPTYKIHEVVQTVGEGFGLNEEDRIELGMAVLTRCCRYADH